MSSGVQREDISLRCHSFLSCTAPCTPIPDRIYQKCFLKALLTLEREPKPRTASGCEYGEQSSHEMPQLCGPQSGYQMQRLSCYYIAFFPDFVLYFDHLLEQISSFAQRHRQPGLPTTAQQCTDLGWSGCPSRPSSSPGRARVAVRDQRLFSGTYPELRTEPLACFHGWTSRAALTADCSSAARAKLRTAERWSNLIGSKALLLLCSTHMTISRARPRVEIAYFSP